MVSLAPTGDGLLGQELALLQDAMDAQDAELAKLRSRENELSVQLRNHKNLEIEVEDLRRVNKELELENRRQAFHFQKLEEAQLKKSNSAFSSGMRDISGIGASELQKAQAHAEELGKQVRQLQQSRFNEVEELVYLRWVNACLRFEIKNGGKGGRGAAQLSSKMSPRSAAMAKKLMDQYAANGGMAGEGGMGGGVPKKRGLVSKFFGRGGADDSPPPKSRRQGDKTSPGSSRGHTSTGQGGGKAVGSVVTTPMGHGTGPTATSRQFKIKHGKPVNRGGLEEAIDGVELNKICSFKSPDVKRRPTRKLRPPPTKGKKRSKPKTAALSAAPGGIPLPPPLPGMGGIPPPPPPMPGMGPLPAPGAMMGLGSLGMVRAPEVIKLYQMMMKRDGEHVVKDGDGKSKKDPTKEMVSELNGRSAHLVAIQQDVEDQKGFVEELAAELRDAEVEEIEDVVELVAWLDEELDFLVDEHAVLKHFKHLWPEAKADTLREAACEYQELARLETNTLACAEESVQESAELACKKLLGQMEKVEQKTYVLLRSREGFVRRMKEHGVPHAWINDGGLLGKLKLATVHLARHFMARVAGEVDRLVSDDDEPEREYLLLEGVRFAFRVHQFAGGFDGDTMKAFMELREVAMSAGGGATATAMGA